MVGLERFAFALVTTWTCTVVAPADRKAASTFTKIFADTYARDNIRMNNVLPGWIDSLPATEERRQSVPLQRYGKSEEVAATIAFLVSEGAAYITGQNIRIDGGLMRSI